MRQVYQVIFLSLVILIAGCSADSKVDESNSADKSEGNQMESKQDSNTNAEDMNTQYPVPDHIQNITDQLEMAMERSTVVEKLGEPNFTFELQKELRKNQKKLDYMYFLNEDNRTYKADQSLSNKEASVKGIELVKKGEIQTFLSIFFDYEKPYGLRNISMFYMQEGELYFYQDNRNAPDKNMPYKDYLKMIGEK